MDDNTLLEKIKKLIGEGHAIAEKLHSMYYYDPFELKIDNAEYYHEVEKWRGIVISVLKFKFGDESQYLKDFLSHIENRNSVSGKYFKENVKSAASTLDYIYEVLKEGLAEDLSYQRQILTFSDLLLQAYHFLDEDLKLAAGIYGRLVLETTVKEYASKIGIVESSFDQIIIKLRLSGKIKKPLENSLRANYEIGSWAAHNNREFTELSNNSVKEFLDFVRDKVLTLK